MVGRPGKMVQIRAQAVDCGLLPNDWQRADCSQSPDRIKPEEVCEDGWRQSRYNVQARMHQGPNQSQARNC
jgi:hypothetical protein